VQKKNLIGINVKNVNFREFLRRLRIADVYLKDARANRKETHVWYLAPPAAKAKHACPISRPHDLHLQYSVMVTNLHTNYSSFYLPRRVGSQSRACPQSCARVMTVESQVDSRDTRAESRVIAFSRGRVDVNCYVLIK